MTAPHLKPIESLWKVGDVCTYLNKKKTYVYGAAARGELPSMNIGGSLRFDPEQIRAWAAARGRGKASVIPIAPARAGG